MEIIMLMAVILSIDRANRIMVNDWLVKFVLYRFENVLRACIASFSLLSGFYKFGAESFCVFEEQITFLFQLQTPIEHTAATTTAGSSPDSGYIDKVCSFVCFILSTFLFRIANASNRKTHASVPS
jgi:hypothetical protein